MKINPSYQGTSRPSPARLASVSRPASTAVLEDLKQALLAEQLAGVAEASLRDRLQRAAAESAAIAWTTPYPLLALPELLAEKGREARHQYERQQAICRRSRASISLPA